MDPMNFRLSNEAEFEPAPKVVARKESNSVDTTELRLKLEQWGRVLAALIVVCLMVLLVYTVFFEELPMVYKSASSGEVVSVVYKGKPVTDPKLRKSLIEDSRWEGGGPVWVP